LSEEFRSVGLVHRRLRLPLVLVLDERVPLDETRASVEVQVQVLDLAVLREVLVEIVLLRLLVHARDEDDPPLRGARGTGAGTALGVGEGLVRAADVQIALVRFLRVTASLRIRGSGGGVGGVRVSAGSTRET